MLNVCFLLNDQVYLKYSYIPIHQIAFNDIILGDVLLNINYLFIH